MGVDRCVCHQVTFRELKEVADRLAIGGSARPTFEMVARETGCGTSCTLCKPYIEVMLATGRTELPVMSEEECRQLVQQSRPD